jgi:hypothetical protein
MERLRVLNLALTRKREGLNGQRSWFCILELADVMTAHDARGHRDEGSIRDTERCRINSKSKSKAML